jgi:pimeloyl-ACP methyl ester carboxylesterase
MALPTIVFVHGAWHQPYFFHKVKAILESKGYRTVVLALPSVGRTPPVTSLNEDISVIRTAVLKELDAGQNVVINAHSTPDSVDCKSG